MLVPTTNFLRMNLPLLVGLQCLLYAVLWAASSLWLRQELRSTLLWMAYALTAGLSLVLIGLRPEGPPWLTYTAASAFQLLGLAFARYGVEIFFRVRPRKIEYFATLCFGGVAFVVIGPYADAPRIALASLLSASLMLGAMLSCWSPMREEFGRSFGLVAAVPIGALMLVNLKFGWNALQGQTGQMNHAGAMQTLVWSITLVAAAVFNFLFLFLLGMRMQRSLARIATHDPLTGILNRRGMQSLLHAEWQRSQRYGTPFAVISLDVDHFKRVNDTHGHAVGDKVLVAVAALLGKEVRDTDRVARMGGEEFLVLLPACRAEVEGLCLAQRLRTVLGHTAVPLEHGAAIRVTASWGVAGPLAQDASVEGLLRRADAALYQGKRQGRDGVVLWDADAQHVLPAGTSGADTGAVDGLIRQA